MMNIIEFLVLKSFSEKFFFALIYSKGRLNTLTAMIPKEYWLVSQNQRSALDKGMLLLELGS